MSILEFSPSIIVFNFLRVQKSYPNGVVSDPNVKLGEFDWSTKKE